MWLKFFLIKTEWQKICDWNCNTKFLWLSNSDSNISISDWSNSDDSNSDNSNSDSNNSGCSNNDSSNGHSNNRNGINNDRSNNLFQYFFTHLYDYIKTTTKNHPFPLKITA